MTATNHALTGAAIGLLVGQSWIALPAALLSHFVCDALPHFGSADPLVLQRPWFSRLLLIDATGCVVLVGVLAVNHPLHWVLAALCAFAATSPDLMWLPRYLRARRSLAAKPLQSWLLRFHSRIQWFERPFGSVVEVAWFGGVGSVVVALLRG